METQQLTYVIVKNLTTECCREMLLCRVAGNSTACLGFHVECLLLNIFGVSGQIFMEVTNIEFHGSLSSGSRADTCGQTAFRENANARKK
jgi:hypothetical protein